MTHQIILLCSIISIDLNSKSLEQGAQSRQIKIGSMGRVYDVHRHKDLTLLNSNQQDKQENKNNLYYFNLNLSLTPKCCPGGTSISYPFLRAYGLATPIYPKLPYSALTWYKNYEIGFTYVRHFGCGNCCPKTLNFASKSSRRSSWDSVSCGSDMNPITSSAPVTAYIILVRWLWRIPSCVGR